jgi:predicted enzyme related to lactoylglutathione lyase
MERSTLAPPVGGAMIPPAAKLSRSPLRDIERWGLMASFTDPDGNVLGLCHLVYEQ